MGKEVERHKLNEASKEHDNMLKSMLLKGESVAYHAQDIYVTNRRIIKYRVGLWARLMHFFYNTFEDLDLKHLESIKAKNVINLRLLGWGFFVLLLGPIAYVVSAIPGIGPIGDYVLTHIVDDLGLGGLLIIGIILIICSLLLRDRVVEFYGQGSVMRAKHFVDEELVKIRELQLGRLKKP